MTMLAIFIVITALAVIVGFTVGLLLVPVRADRPVTNKNTTPVMDTVEVVSDTERLIEEAAASLAEARDRPWAAPMIASKLRLAYEMRERRSRS